MRGRGKVGREGNGGGGCVMAVGGMDAPDQLTKVKVCPPYNFLIFMPPPTPRISVTHIASPGVRLDAPVLINNNIYYYCNYYY